jgi:NitT/TauT family transport system substrate-binding protein
MDQAVKIDAKRGAHILVSSASYPGTIIDAIIVNQKNLSADPAAYKNFLIGIYQAIAYYNTNPTDFIKLAAPHFDLSAKDFKASIDGSLTYTTLAMAQKYFGTAAAPGPIYGVFDTLMKLNLANGASDHSLMAKPSFDDSVLASLTSADLK